jgi:hypothetical protein
MSFQKLQRENSYVSQKENKINNDKKKWLKTISKLRKQIKKLTFKKRRQKETFLPPFFHDELNKKHNKSNNRKDYQEYAN